MKILITIPFKGMEFANPRTDETKPKKLNLGSIKSHMDKGIYNN
jgi:hypothetical protein